MTAPRKSIQAIYLLLLVFYGCAAAPKMTAIMDFASPEAALGHLAVQFPAETVLQALADCRVASQDAIYPLKLAVLLKRPASLRIEAIPLFGPPTFFLSLRDGTLKAFLTDTRVFYIGRATPENVVRYLPLKMNPEDLITVLTGIGYAPPGPDTVLKGHPEGDRYRIDIVEPSKSRSLWVRMTDGFLECLEVYGERQRLYQARFEEPLRKAGTMVPQKITIDSGGADGVSVSIRYRDIQFLKDVDPGAFDLMQPPNVEPLYLN